MTAKRRNVSTIIWTIVNIVTNILLFIFMTDLLQGFNFGNGFTYSFTLSRVLLIIAFVLAQVSGVILLVSFFKRLHLRGRLVYTTAALTLMLVGGVYIFLNIETFNGPNELTIKRVLSLNEMQGSDVGFSSILLAFIIYLILVYVAFSAIIKASKKQMIKNNCQGE